MEDAYVIQKPDNPVSIAINGKDGQLLLELIIEDGVLTAKYEPKNLDEAAQIFVSTVMNIAAGL